MLTRFLPIMLALTLSSSLSSSPNQVVAKKQNNSVVSSIVFYDPELKSPIDKQVLESILGVSTGNKYPDQYISDRITKLEELTSYKVADWNLSSSGELRINMSKKKKIAAVSFLNNKSISSSKLSNELGFRTEGAYCEDVCPVIITKIRKCYADQGFYSANVELKKEQLPDGGLKIIVDVSEGEPATISDINLEATGIINVDELKAILAINKGDSVRYSYIQERLKRLKSYLFNEGCYTASIYKNSIKVSDDAKSASIEIGVRTGPKFSMVFRGNSVFQNPQVLKKSLDITETDVVSKEYYSVLIKRLENFYYSMGFTEPKINITEVMGDKEWELKLAFNINEGPRKSFRNVLYNVQKAPVYTYMLKEYVRDKKVELFDRGFFVKKDFEDIRQTIEDFFTEQGFLRARVIAVNFKEVFKNVVDITYDVDAGSETIIRNIHVKGNTAFTDQQIVSKLGLAEDSGLKLQPFNKNVKDFIKEYRALGYADVYLEKEGVISYSEDYRVADLNINIYEGKKYKIGKIFIEGLVKTKERVVTRELEFEEDQKIVFESLQDSENKLAGLGLFGSVSVILLTNSVKGDGYKDVLVKVEEKKSGVYEIGFGYKTDDGINASTGVTYGNLGGWNRRINLDASIARRLDNQFKFVQYNVTAGYYEPYFCNLPLDFRLTAGYKQEDLVSYGKRTLDMSFYLEKTFGYHTLTLRNSFQRINVFDAPIDADNTAYWKYSIRQTYKLDTRDSVFSPNKGLLLTVYGEWGRSLQTKAFGNYVKAVEVAKYYLPILKSWAFVPSFSSGYVKGIRGESVLLDDRFALGGMDSIRGYREAIINDLTPQIGSQYFYTNTLELRRTLFWRLVGVVFHDIGNISSQDPALSGPFSSVGGGINLRLPVGSLSLQYGYIYKLDKRVPPDKMGRIHFSLGTF